VAASGAVGNAAEVEGDAVPGVVATGSVGTVGVGPPTYLITGVSASGGVGTVSPTIEVGISGVSATGEVGAAGLAGVLGTGAVQSVSVGDRLVAITGCPAMGVVGNIGYAYWKLIDDDQTPNWTGVTTTGNPVWTSITTTEDSNWVEVETV
jgi:hypothetical protein